MNICIAGVPARLPAMDNYRNKGCSSSLTGREYKKVILPKATERDLPDIPEDVRNEPTFVQVETVEEILKRGAGHRATPYRSAAGGEQYYTGVGRLNMEGIRKGEGAAGRDSGGEITPLASLSTLESLLSISPSSCPFRLAIAPPKGAISGHFGARFIPNPAKRGEICVFQKTIVLIFR
ncbi:MAG: hypothetical protein NTV10_00585 [Methanoregula sp.]|nr:hypothetical protein [Methanoregula sp.]